MTAIRKKILGKLIRPKDPVGAYTKNLFGGSDNNYGIIYDAEWDSENRILYIGIFVNNKKIQREYNSYSVFSSFWEVVE